MAYAVMRYKSCNSRGLRVGLMLTGCALLALPAPRSQAALPFPGETPALPQNSSPKQAAPIDLTGQWVAEVTESWDQRMVRPARGDYQSVPLNLLAYQTALQWDPAKDEAAGEQCRAFGAAGIMQFPERLRISWQDESTLEVEIDAGTQTRLFHFADTQGAATTPSWQGNSAASWRITLPPMGAVGPGRDTRKEGEDLTGGGAPGAPAGMPAHSLGGSLKVVTTRLRAGYLRTNGLPYSDQTVLTEYWDLIQDRSGQPWIILTSIVHDPVYLQDDWITALHFKREADGSKWNPQPCTATW